MTMEIKPGDIVEYQGKQVRVMDMRNNQSGFRECLTLSNFGYDVVVSINNVKLVESVHEPTVKDYDDVVIGDIPYEEKTCYGVGWGPDMDKLVASYTPHKITNIHYSYRFGWIGTIGGYNFQLYHIEPANSFDII